MKQVKIAEAVGKTIKACSKKWDNSSLLLLFDDDTCAFLEIQYGYELGDEEITDGILDAREMKELKRLPEKYGDTIPDPVL